MKSLKEVEENRILYHSKPHHNTIHRASLMAPVIPGSRVGISFLNHFLIKRNYSHVALKVTGLDGHGQKGSDITVSITEPRVYSFDLQELLPGNFSLYNVEFFSEQNLFIPFPAVMVNHTTPVSKNQVHSFNRVLNDVFENDKVNANHVRESNIDVIFNENAETFLLFQVGPQPIRDSLSVELKISGKTLSKNIDINAERFEHKLFRISEIFPEIKSATQGILKVLQPKQFMFYGRMMCGLIGKDGSLIANHSYYDSSEFAEYWKDNSPSRIHYPYFKELTQKLRFYPIMSPSNLSLRLRAFDIHGKEIIPLATVGRIISPSDEVFEINVNKLVGKLPVSSFELVVESETPLPTRVNHQVVYSGNEKSESSVNLSFKNPNVFNPPGKKGFVWGQLYADESYDSYLGITSYDFKDNKESSEGYLEIYSEQGCVFEKSFPFSSIASVQWKLSELVPGAKGYHWFVFKAPTPNLSSFSVIVNKITGHCSGEHGF